MKNFKFIYCLLALSFLVTSCDNDDDDNLIEVGFEKADYNQEYNLITGEELSLSPALKNTTSKTIYTWTLEEEVISNTKELNYTFNQAGTYKLKLQINHGRQNSERTYTIHVEDTFEAFSRPKTENSSPYISEILTYKPAPGQFLNTSYANEEAAQSLIGVKDGMVSLGAWGGYIEFKFDHTIENLKDEKDFVVYGNAFDGSSEPGIVQVSFDENGNGVADDLWYEIAGSEHYKESTIRDYELTYYNPKEAVGIPFKDNSGKLDTIKTNTYHKQAYYPAFIPEQDSVTFKGTRLILPFTKNEQGWTVLDNFDSGYSDNYSEEYSKYKGNTIDISWAVDKNFEKVELKGVDFIRVYTGVLGQNSMLGEVSTEVNGAADLSLLD